MLLHPHQSAVQSPRNRCLSCTRCIRTTHHLVKRSLGLFDMAYSQNKLRTHQRCVQPTDATAADIFDRFRCMISSSSFRAVMNDGSRRPICLVSPGVHSQSLEASAPPTFSHRTRYQKKITNVTFILTPPTSSLTPNLACLHIRLCIFPLVVKRLLCTAWGPSFSAIFGVSPIPLPPASPAIVNICHDTHLHFHQQAGLAQLGERQTEVHFRKSRDLKVVCSIHTNRNTTRITRVIRVGSIFVFLASFFFLGSTDVMKMPEVNNTVDSRGI